MSFQVYQVDGFDEPWWFEDDWHEQVVAVQTAASLEEAATIFQSESIKLQGLFPKSRSRIEGMRAFWQPGETAWCEPCANDEQVYHSLVIYENQKALSSERVDELTDILANINRQNNDNHQDAKEG
ncbi:DUF1033 family protein [Aerococcaceae bacterium 50-4]